MNLFTLSLLNLCKTKMPRTPSGQTQARPGARHPARLARENFLSSGL